MKLILLEDVVKVGKAGDVVDVSDGYGRNYLLPKKLGVMATSKSIKNSDKIKKAAEEKALRAQNMLKATAIEMDGTEIQFLRKADENGHLYGSVSEIDIISALKEKGFDVHKDMIDVEKHFKELGQYEVTIKFSPEIQTAIAVDIKAED